MNVDWEKVSYILGQQIGHDFKNQSMEMNMDTFCTSLRSAFEGNPSIMSGEEIQEVMTGFQQFMQAKQMEQAQVAGAANLEMGLKFLDANKEKEGVVTLESGLQYKVLTEGTGEKPSATDTVETHYEGKLIDGTVFDSSYQRGETTSFPVDRVIKGWTEALQLMPTGSKWQLFIPSELAYGVQGAPPAIGPSSTLLFDIELISIK